MKAVKWMIVVAMVVGGIWSLNLIPLDALPDISDVQVIVHTGWAGEPPDVIEDQVTYPIVTSLLTGNVSFAPTGLFPLFLLRCLGRNSQNASFPRYFTTLLLGQQNAVRGTRFVMSTSAARTIQARITTEETLFSTRT